MTLTECAERLGVETHTGKRVECGGRVGRGMVGTELQRRPTLDIAHEVLAKLPPRFDEGEEVWGLFFVGDSRWAWYWGRALGDDPSGTAAFEECVTALAERYFASADS